jgi:hypothetical protein
MEKRKEKKLYNIIVTKKRFFRITGKRKIKE